MARSKKQSKQSRARHSEEFKTEALALCEKVGVSEAAKQLGIHPSQIYNWKGKAKHNQTVSQRERDLATEVAKLKRQLVEQTEELAILKKASAYFAKQLK